MRNTLIALGALAASALLPSPASAQYRFDPSVDPSVCHWQDICDYGGRAIRTHYIHKVRFRCPLVVSEQIGPNGEVTTVRTRECGGLRSRG